MAAGTVIAISIQGDTNRGILAPDDLQCPLGFIQADTEAGGSGQAKTLVTTLVGSSVNYVYDAGTGRAKQVRFAT